MTIIIFGVFIILFIIIIRLVSSLLNLSKMNERELLLTQIQSKAKIIYIVIFIMFMINIGITLIGFYNTDLFFFHLIKNIIQIIFIYQIYRSLSELISNINREMICSKVNVKIVRDMGNIFFYLANTEIVLGIILGIGNLIYIDNGDGLNFQFDYSLFLYLFLGLILILASIVMQSMFETYNKEES